MKCLLFLALVGCATAPADPGPPCYGTWTDQHYACAEDWTGIDALPSAEGTGGGRACACPEGTSCHPIPLDPPVVACALNAR